MLYIKIFLFVYALLFLVFLFINKRYALNLLWAGIFIVPYRVYTMRFLPGCSLIEFQSLIIFLFLSSKSIKGIISVIYPIRHSLFFYLCTCVLLLLFSTAVPCIMQIRYYKNEFFEFLLLIVTWYCLRSDRDTVLSLLKVLVVCLLLNAFYGFYSVIVGVNIFATPLNILLGVDIDNAVDMINQSRGFLSFRLQSLFEHPLTLAQCYLLLLPAILWNKKYFSKRSYIAIVITITISIFLTGSRSALFPLVLMFLYFFISYLRKKRKYVFPFFCIVICSMFLLNSIQTEDREYKDVVQSIKASVFFWDESLQKKQKIEGSSVSMRINQLDAMVDIISQTNIFVGYGRGFREVFAARSTKIDGKLLGFESVFLLKPVEQGILGLFSYFILIFYLWKLFMRKRKTREYITVLYSIFILSIIMTGIRPYSFIMLGLSSGLICFSENNINRKGECKEKYLKI